MPLNYISATERIYFDSASLNPAAYQVINTYGFEGACSIISIVNRSDSNIFISYDGIVDHDYIPAYDIFTLNTAVNKSLLKKYSHIYVRGSVRKFGGYIYLIGYYNP